MKRQCFAWILAFAMLLGGCQQEEKPESYTPCQMVPGTLEAARLQAEPGNYGRSKELLAGAFVENETGYYRIADGCLYYADKTDLSEWVVVCPKPNCLHTVNEGCVARAYTDSGLVFENGRFYFLAQAGTHQHLYNGSGEASGYLLCSMAQDGSDMRMEHVCEEALLNGGGGLMGGFTFPGGYVVGLAKLNTDGTYTQQLWNIDGAQEQLLFEREYDEEIRPMANIHSARFLHGLRGDRAFCTGMFGGDPFQNLCWVQDGELHTVSVDTIPYRLKYLSGNTLRAFATNDGYYDYDLLTGESVKLADPQLDNSGAFILQPNCILESTMIFSGVPEVEEKANQMEEQRLMFFDGQQWHEVRVPDEILAVMDTAYLGVRGLFSDCVMFSVTMDGATRLYRMALSAKHYQLEYCGQFH